MAFYVTTECINCDSCWFECSFGAIHGGGLHTLIDAVRCRECGACAQICPMQAIEAPALGGLLGRSGSVLRSPGTPDISLH